MTAGPTAAGTSAGPAGATPTSRARGVSRRLDTPLTSYYLVLGATMALVVIGLVMVLSSSSVESYVDTGSSFAVFLRQAMFAAIGAAADGGRGAAAARDVAGAGLAALVGALVGQLLVFTPLGVDVNGNRNWIEIAGMRMQPSEAAKLALVVWCGVRAVAQAGAARPALARAGARRPGRRAHALPRAARARPRHVAGAHGARRRRPLRGRRAAAGVRRRRRARRARRVRAGHRQREPDEPDRRLGRWRLQRRAGLPDHVLAVDPRAVGAGLRRVVGRRPRRQPGEVGPAARGAQRLHLRRHRRGARAAPARSSCSPCSPRSAWDSSGSCCARTTSSSRSSPAA